MNPGNIKDICLALPGATFDLKEEWGSELGRVEGKIFAMLGTDSQDIQILTLKATPETCVDLKMQFPSWISSGYYMNKRHWISIHIDSDACDPRLVASLIQDSYILIFDALPKKVQNTIKKP